MVGGEASARVVVVGGEASDTGKIRTMDALLAIAIILPVTPVAENTCNSEIIVERNRITLWVYRA